MMPLPDLLAALKAATGHDARLNEEIAMRAGWRVSRVGMSTPYCQPPPEWPEEFAGGWGAPNFTTSLDEVLRWLPAGAEWMRHRGANGRMTMVVSVPAWSR